MKSFNIHIEADINMTELGVWPDGNAPDDPTAEDVRDVILANYRDRVRFLRDWNLENDLGVEVDTVEVWA